MNLPSKSAASRAFGALAIGAVAIGALAVGATAIGRLAIDRARIRRLEIDTNPSSGACALLKRFRCRLRLVLGTDMGVELVPQKLAVWKRDGGRCVQWQQCEQ
ncbi:MAG: hypothetical protein ABIN99_05150, partial [Nitrosospira sp.]